MERCIQAEANAFNFGRIDLATFRTTRLISNLPAAHDGLVFDPYTGDLILVGNDSISQFDPRSSRITSTTTSLKYTMRSPSWPAFLAATGMTASRVAKAPTSSWGTTAKTA